MSSRGDTVHTNLGHVTPPDEWKHELDDAGVSQLPPVPKQSMRSGEESSSSASTSSARRGKVDKRDKYREKNRVAAAKCRAKKKENTDGLEESHRTQSMLNGLLKQTEQNLRDELSFLRTQALQHGFCECRSIQDYNLEKAKALARDRGYAGSSDDAGPSPGPYDFGDAGELGDDCLHFQPGERGDGFEEASPTL